MAPEHAMGPSDPRYWQYDGTVLRQTLPDTLRWLWVGYPIE